MTVHAITMRRREHSSLHLNGIQTEMRRSAVSKINVHDDTCVDRANRKKVGESDATKLTGYWFGEAVTAFVTSTKLRCVEPGKYWDLVSVFIQATQAHSACHPYMERCNANKHLIYLIRYILYITVLSNSI